jgi:hypothetical protein
MYCSECLSFQNTLDYLKTIESNNDCVSCQDSWEKAWVSTDDMYVKHIENVHRSMPLDYEQYRALYATDNTLNEEIKHIIKIMRCNQSARSRYADLLEIVAGVV